jgi:2-dehydrotetronate isomerase
MNEGLAKEREEFVLRIEPNLRWLFTELPMLDRYAAAARAGFRGVEVAFPYEYPAREIAKRLDDNGLTLVQILTPCNWEAGERGIAALPDRVADFRDSVKTALEFAVQVGKPMVHAMAGNIPAGLDRRRCFDVFVENIAFAASCAADHGITIILEPCCRARFPDYLYRRLDEGVEVIKQVDRPNVKLCYDTFHVQSEEGSLTDRLKDLFPYIGHIQVGDVPGRHEPGTGEINFPFILRQIEELGWKGWIGCEYSPSGGTTETLSWAKMYGVG